jgi:pimeloyl-ACP methyl ester carboxylesterase
MPVAAGFYDRYDAVLRKWPVPHEAADLPGRFGVTHVNMCGAEGGPPVVLLPGGRATSAGWYANAGALAPARGVYAVDILGDAGRSVPGGEPVASRDDIVAWLDGVLDGLGVGATALGGHSYGGWIAARYAIARPERVSSLVLVDPTGAFSATPLAFRLRGIPLFVGRDRDRFRRFHRWETGGRPVDPEFLDLWAGPFGGPRAGRFVWPKVPRQAELARLTMPVLVFAAGQSRQNKAAALAGAAGKLADARVVVVTDATHFTMPQDQPDEINPVLADFLAS